MLHGLASAAPPDWRIFLPAVERSADEAHEALFFLIFYFWIL